MFQTSLAILILSITIAPHGVGSSDLVQFKRVSQCRITQDNSSVVDNVGSSNQCPMLCLRTPGCAGYSVHNDMSGSILCVATITSYTEAMTRRQLAAGTSWNLWVSQKNSVSVPDIQQCQNLLVSGNNPIPDSHITASSSFAMFGFTPQHSRLTNDASSGTLGGWAVDGGSINTNQWLQFDLGSKHVITAVVTKGRALDGHNHYQWVTSYKLHFSSDAVTWTTYQTECGSDVVFQGNTDTNTLKQNTLQGLNKMMPVIFARYVRINPQTFHNYPTMRGDVLGCVLGT